MVMVAEELGSSPRASKTARLLLVSPCVLPVLHPGDILPVSRSPRPSALLQSIPQSVSALRSTCSGVDSNSPSLVPLLPRAAAAAAGSVYRRLGSRGPGSTSRKPLLSSPSPG